MPERTPFDLSRCRLCVILNPGSGKKDEGELENTLTEVLKPRVAEFALRKAAHGSNLPDMARHAVDGGFDIIVAAGGDGTQSAVAGALAGSDAIMAVIPGGTFNYFARDLGTGETVEDALETILDARVDSVDLGRINDLVFLNNVSFGAYPHILKTREGIYRRWGRSRIAAYWSVIAALRRLRHPMRLTAHVDGRQHEFTTALAFVARSAFQLDSFGLEGADAIRQGQFAVLIAKAKQPMPLMGSAFRLAFGRSAKDSDFDLILTDEIEIVTRPNRQLVAHDGEKSVMAGPFRLKVTPGDLRILLPADGRNKTAGGVRA